jgi:hypothetical protein
MPPGRKKNVTPTHLRKIKHLTCHATRFRARQEGFLQRSLGWHQSLMPLRSRRIFGGLPGDKSFNVPSPGLERRTRLVGEVVAFRRCRGVIDVILVTLDQMPSKRPGVVGFQIASARAEFRVWSSRARRFYKPRWKEARSEVKNTLSSRRRAAEGFNATVHVPSRAHQKF